MMKMNEVNFHCNVSPWTKLDANVLTPTTFVDVSLETCSIGVSSAFSVTGVDSVMDSLF